MQKFSFIVLIAAICFLNSAQASRFPVLQQYRVTSIDQENDINIICASKHITVAINEDSTDQYFSFYDATPAESSQPAHRQGWREWTRPDSDLGNLIKEINGTYQILYYHKDVYDIERRSNGISYKYNKDGVPGSSFVRADENCTVIDLKK